METKLLTLIILIPIISAFIGWLTNYIAIKSLFQPIKPKKFFILTFQGVIPKRKKALSSNIANVVEKYLFSHKDILEEFERPENINKIKKKILPIIENKIIDKIPDMFKAFAAPVVKKVLESEIDSLIKQINIEIGNHLLENVDIKQNN